MESKPKGKSGKRKLEFKAVVDENGKHCFETLDEENNYLVRFYGKECSEEETEAQKEQREKAIVDLFWGIILENIENGTFMNHGNNSEIDKSDECASSSVDKSIKDDIK